MLAVERSRNALALQPQWSGQDADYSFKDSIYGLRPISEHSGNGGAIGRNSMRQ